MYNTNNTPAHVRMSEIQTHETLAPTLNAYPLDYTHDLCELKKKKKKKKKKTNKQTNKQKNKKQLNK